MPASYEDKLVMPDNKLNCMYLGYKLNTSTDRLAVNGSLVDDYVLL